MQSIYDQVMTTLYMVWRKRWYGLVAMWMVCLVGWGIVATIPDVYEARARIFVDTNSVLPNMLNQRGMNNNPLRQVDIVRRTLISRPNLEKVIRRSDLDLTIQDESEMEVLITELTDNIKLESQGGDLFSLAYRSGSRDLSREDNAQRAKMVVGQLMNIFIEANTGEQRSQFTTALRFLDEQIADYERQLEAAEKRKADFERQYLGLLPGDGNFTSQIDQRRRELEQVSQSLMQARSSRAALGAQMRSVPSTLPGQVFSFNGGPSFDASTTSGRIQQLELQITDSLARGYTDQHPDIVTARNQIKRLQQQAASEKSSGNAPASASGPRQPNPSFVALQSRMFDKDSEIAALSARQASLQAELAELQGKAEGAPGIEAEMMKLNRDYDAQKKKYNELLASREEAVVAGNVENSTDRVQMRIVDPPEVPLKPVAPNRPLLLSGVTAVGLLVGIAIAFMMSHLHTTYVSIGGLRNATNLPVLGGVSAILTEQQRTQERLRLGLFAIAFLGLVGVYAILLVLETIQRGQAI